MRVNTGGRDELLKLSSLDSFKIEPIGHIDHCLEVKATVTSMDMGSAELANEGDRLTTSDCIFPHGEGGG